MEILVTKPAPQFEAQALVDGTITQLKSVDYLGKYVILLFYPLNLYF